MFPFNTHQNPMKKIFKIKTCMSYPNWCKLGSLKGFTWQYVFLIPILLALKKQQATPWLAGEQFWNHWCKSLSSLCGQTSEDLTLISVNQNLWLHNFQKKRTNHKMWYLVLECLFSYMEENTDSTKNWKKNNHSGKICRHKWYNPK